VNKVRVCAKAWCMASVASPCGAAPPTQHPRRHRLHCRAVTLAHAYRTLLADKCEPLQYNVDALHGVSFSKGCYVGQEKNSMTHYRGLIRRRCMPFEMSQGPGGWPGAKLQH